MAGYFVLLLALGAVAALPTDPVIAKLDPNGLRYKYMRADDGTPHLVDSWVKVSDLTSRYNPDFDNQYHLFTRFNPNLSQPLLENRPDILLNSNYDPRKNTIVLIHGSGGSVVSSFNTVLVPAYLSAADVNVIVVDWGVGANWGLNGIDSGVAVARVLQWISLTAGSSLADFKLVGIDAGAHQAGIIGKRLPGQIGYITGLDPAFTWFYPDTLNPADARYTEVIHTNAGELGYELPLGDVDFYPNGGTEQPGCATLTYCNRDRSFFFLAESLSTGGFIGWECASFQEALSSNCQGRRLLEMGGLSDKDGSQGIFSLTTNASPPFAQGEPEFPDDSEEESEESSEEESSEESSEEDSEDSEGDSGDSEGDSADSEGDSGDSEGDSGASEGDSEQEPDGDSEEGSEEQPDGDSEEGSEEQPDGDSEEQPDGDSEEQPDGEGGSEEKPDGEGDSEEKPDGEGDSEEKPDGEGDSEEQPDGEGDSEEKPDGEGDSEEKPDGDGDSEEKPDGEGGSEEKPDGEGGSEEQPDGEGGSQEQPDGDSEQEPEIQTKQ